MEYWYSITYLTGAGTFSMWALIYHLFQYWERSLQAEKDRLQLQATLKENQYQNLRTQLNPHFLFNSLNSIRTLIDLNPDLSKEAITRLSGLLRSSLQMNNKKTVPLRNEISTLEDYLAIEKIRFDDRLNISFSIRSYNPIYGSATYDATNLGRKLCKAWNFEPKTGWFC
jgi:LytS/YehU family sensor histidine kinase